jgi:hypothetical protein
LQAACRAFAAGLQVVLLSLCGFFLKNSMKRRRCQFNFPEIGTRFTKAGFMGYDF